LRMVSMLSLGSGYGLKVRVRVCKVTKLAKCCTKPLLLKA
jgi:hypothetical protein